MNGVRTGERPQARPGGLGVSRPVRVAPRPTRTEDATVSVVVPCYNYGRYLTEAVTSVLEQRDVTVEVIVVDDASTDDSLRVARRLATEDPRVTVVAHPVNRGPVETFNDGLGRASGEFLVRLDADDLLTPGSLARSVAVARAFPSVGLVYGHPLHFSDARPAARLRPRRWTVWPGTQWLWDRCLDGYNVITSPEALMRMSVVEQVGGQRPLAHTHDMEMWLRVAAFSDVAHVGGCDQAWHRDHPASLSARAVDDATDLGERVAAFDELAGGVAAQLPEMADMRAAAQRALVRQVLRACRYEVARGSRDRSRVRRLMAQALELDPHLATTAAWTTLASATDERPRPVRRAAGLLGAAVIRGDDVRRGLRWSRTGTYTRERRRPWPRVVTAATLPDRQSTTTQRGSRDS